MLVFLQTFAHEHVGSIQKSDKLENEWGKLPQIFHDLGLYTVTSSSSVGGLTRRKG
jgi:hypothetical protein